MRYKEERIQISFFFFLFGYQSVERWKVFAFFSIKTATKSDDALVQRTIGGMTDERKLPGIEDVVYMDSVRKDDINCALKS